jgi:hypothetical protein
LIYNRIAAFDFDGDIGLTGAHTEATTRISVRSASAISSISAFMTSRAPAAIPQVPICTVIFVFAGPSLSEFNLAVFSLICLRSSIVNFAILCLHISTVRFYVTSAL